MDPPAGGQEELRAQIPVSMHHRDEDPDALGNRDSFLFVDLPVHEPDAVRRVELINAETTVRKAAPTPTPCTRSSTRPRDSARWGASSSTPPRARASSASRSPTSRGRASRSTSSAPVVELCSIAEPAERHALRVSALSCDGTMQFGVCTDPDAIAELGELAEAIDEAIDELQMRC